MHIVHIASEIAPIAKVGGLADVMMGLGRELKWKGHEVDIFIPKYDTLLTQYLSLKKSKEKVASFFRGAWYDNSIWNSGLLHDMSVTFFEPHHPAKFFERGGIYGFPDDIDRFLYFSRACLDYLHTRDTIPDIIHVHDWETAAIAWMIRDEEFREHFQDTKVVLTIHNMEYQGYAPHDAPRSIGYRGAIEPMLQGGCTNLLKGGIIAADAITTVSPTHAKEILTPEGSKGLLDTILANKGKFSGILNGIDYTYWNPEIDQYFTSHYSEDDLAGKAAMKEEVIAEFGLEKTPEKPLLVSVSRLVSMKGLDLLKHTLERAHDFGYQYILLGSTGDPVTNEEFLKLQKRFDAGREVRIVLRSEEALAHRLYAAADIFMMPSLFEPCGLAQLIALKYGSPPIVRRTGGLIDTVFDVDCSGRPFEKTNGFTFDNPDPDSLDRVLKRAVRLWKEDKKKWHALMVQGMCQDFSWNLPTDQYLALYRSLIA
jgi:starch synthase